MMGWVPGVKIQCARTRLIRCPVVKSSRGWEQHAQHAGPSQRPHPGREHPEKTTTGLPECGPAQGAHVRVKKWQRATTAGQRSSFLRASLQGARASLDVLSRGSSTQHQPEGRHEGR
jgi:hypothetical protein